MAHTRRPWGYHTRYRGHKHEEPITIPAFIVWWRRVHPKNYPR